ncbi:MAG: V-type ATPase subunit [Candidatus Aminicenantales bacterium]
MKKPSRLDYAYAVGRVRALENYLIERAVFQEAAEEMDFSSSLKIIFDTGKFSEEAVEIKNSAQLDAFLEQEEKLLRRLLEELLLERDILEIFLAWNELFRAQERYKKVKSPFIRDFIRHRIDLANLKILSRLKYRGEPRERFESLVIAGGFLDERVLVESFEESLSGIGERIKTSAYAELWNRAIDTLEAKETFLDLERGIEDFMMNYLKAAKYIVFGPEPVFAYGLARKHELDLVRLLGVGKMVGIAPALLKQRISETYV